MVWLQERIDFIKMADKANTLFALLPAALIVASASSVLTGSLSSENTLAGNTY